MLAAEAAVAAVAAGKPMVIIAVSGGVDSVVLLDTMAKNYPVNKIIVAHVNHGIRPEAGKDADFVRQLADKYGVTYRQVNLELGAGASEEQARRGRYKFLRDLANEFEAKIITAHHADDVIETIAINLTRGTGWRGLAVMGAGDIDRPLTHLHKRDLLDYAKNYNITWREDNTNQSDYYLRNRLRKKMKILDSKTQNKLLKLWQNQTNLVQQIDSELNNLITKKRYFYIMTPSKVATEVLRATLGRDDVTQTRPQLEDILLSIKTARAGSRKSINSNTRIAFSKTEFWLEST